MDGGASCPGLTSTFARGFITVAQRGSKIDKPLAAGVRRATAIKPRANVLVSPGYTAHRRSRDPCVGQHRLRQCLHRCCDHLSLGGPVACRRTSVMTRSAPDPADARRTHGVPSGDDTAAPAGAFHTAGAPAPLPLEPGALPLPDYRLVAFLGRGGYGEVWKAVGPGGFAVALKFISAGRTCRRGRGTRGRTARSPKTFAIRTCSACSAPGGATTCSSSPWSWPTVPWPTASTRRSTRGCRACRSRSCWNTCARRPRGWTTSTPSASITATSSRRTCCWSAAASRWPTSVWPRCWNTPAPPTPGR